MNQRIAAAESAGKFNFRRFALWAVMLLALGALPGSAIGQETVTNLNDSGAGSLRNAVANVPNGGTITFNAGLAGGTILLTSGEFVTNKSMSITGPAVGGIVIDPSRNSRIMEVFDAANIDLENLTLLNGRAQAGTGGGAILFDSTGILRIASCTFRGHEAPIAGGAIHATTGSGRLSIKESIFENNESPAGSAIWAQGTVYIFSTLFADNIGSGTLRVYPPDGSVIKDVFVVNTTFFRNSGPVFPTIYVERTGSPRIHNCTFVANQRLGTTPGVFSTRMDEAGAQSWLRLSNSLIAGNLDDVGGADNSFDVAAALNLFGGYNIWESHRLVGMSGDQTFADLGVANVEDVVATSLSSLGGKSSVLPLVPGGPAMNAGDVTALPNDQLDLDNDGILAEPIPYDQRGAGFPRVNGGAPDVGAFELQCDIMVTNANNSGPGSLRQAVLDVCPGGTITFDPNFFLDEAVTPIRLLSEILINKDVTITGLGRERVAIQPGNINVFSHGLEITSGTTVTLELLEMRFFQPDPSGSGDGGGAIINRGDLTLREVTLRNCLRRDGSLVLTLAGSRLHAIDSRLLSGGAFGQSETGGAITALDAEVIVEGSFLSFNRAGTGGALYMMDSTLDVVNSTIVSNQATQGNGASVLYLGSSKNGSHTLGKFRFTTMHFNDQAAAAIVLEAQPGTDGTAAFDTGQSILSTNIQLIARLGETAQTYADASAGYNFIHPFGVTDFDAGAPTNVSTGFAIQGAPDFNGGPTENFLLALSSTLRDAIPAADYPVDGPTTDQRGFPRPDGSGGRADIGAVEFECFGTVVVTDPADTGPGTLRNAVLSACWGDTITFDPAVFVAGGGAPPINLLSQITINKDLSIQGLGTNRVVIRKDDANPTMRLFEVAVSRVVEMSDLTLRDGNQTFGALVRLLGELTLTNCHLLDSTSPGFGGPINVEVPAALVVEPIVNRLVMNGCLVEGNSHSVSGGSWAAIRAVSVPDVTVELDIEDSIFRNNDGSQFNGGFGAVALLRFAPAPATDADIPLATMRLRNVEVADNPSSQVGALYVNHPRSNVLIEDSDFLRNTLPGNATHVRVDSIVGQDGSELTIRNTWIANDTGRGVSASFTKVLIEGSVIENHDFNGSGAGINFAPGNRDVGLEIVDSVVRNNRASSVGGGIYIQGIGGLLQTAPMRIVNSSIVNNTARSFQAGGLQVNDSNLEIIQSTIAGNRVLGQQPGFAFAGGGGIVFSSSNASFPRTLRLWQSTVAQNVTVAPFSVTSTIPTGVFAFNEARLEIGNSIVAGNMRVGFTSAELTVSQTPNLLSSGGNVVGTLNIPLSGQMLASDQFGTTAAPLDARLEPLADYGGGMPTVRPIASVSPALDAGIDANATAELLALDQRGFDRFNGTVDVGAVELQVGEACEPSVVVLNNANSGPGSLRQAVLDVCPGGTITFDPDFFTSEAATPIGLLSEIVINKDLTITGLGRERVAIQRVHGGVFSHGLEIAVGVQATVELLEVRFFFSDTSVSGDGGGAIINHGDLTLREVTLRNSVARDGSLVFNSLGSRLHAIDSRLINAGNLAWTGTGGAITASDAEIILERCYVANNRAVHGGAIHAMDSSVTLLNSTITLNQAANSSGGGYLYLGSSRNGSHVEADVRFCTIFFNDPSGGPGLAMESATGTNGSVAFSLGQSILLASGSQAVARLGETVQTFADASPGYNALPLSYFADFDALALTNISGGIVFSPPTPEFNGGPTETLQLAANSALRDRIPAADYPLDGPTTDQRGLPRPDPISGRADIGAVETECFGTVVVTTDADSGPGSLREAVVNACWGDTITFDPTVFPAAGAPPIDLFTQITIAKDLTIQGLGPDRVVVRKEQSPFNFTRLFQVQSGVTVGFEDMTLRDGYSNLGSLVLSHGSVTFDRCHLLNSRTTGRGGAVYAFRPTPFSDDFVVNAVRLSDCLVADHLYDLVGADLWAPIVGFGSPNAELDMVIERTTFRDNSYASASGGSFGLGGVLSTFWFADGYTSDDVPPANLRISDVTIENNTTTGGGMVYVIHPRFGQLLMENTEIRGNTIPVNATHFIAQVNTATTVPEPGDVIIRDTTISNSTGRGLLASGMNLVVQDSVIENHVTNQFGAGIAVSSFGFDVACEIRNSLIRNNTLNNTGGGGGGGVYFIHNNGPATTQPWRIIDSTIVGNTSRSSFGGGLFTRNVDAEVIQTTVANNRVTSEFPVGVNNGNSPGILHLSDGSPDLRTLTLLQSTVTANVLDADPSVPTTGPLGVYVFGQGAIDIGNTIVAGNSRIGDSNTVDFFVSQGLPPFLASSGGNLIGSMLLSQAASMDPTDQIGTTATPIDPLLGPLQDNGGGFPTLMPLVGSPALNNGIDQTAIDLGLVFDQRGPGFDRFVGTVDIGAVEMQVPDDVEIDGPLTSPFVADGGTTDRCPLGIEVNFTREIVPASFTFDDIVVTNADIFSIRQINATRYLIEIRPLIIGDPTTIQIDGEVEDLLANTYPVTSAVFTLTQDPLPATFAVADGDVYGESGLIYALNMANCQPDETTVRLAYRGEYVLDRVEDTAPETPSFSISGASGLPAIFTPVIVEGDGALIRRNLAAVDFRHFFVNPQGNLTLRQVILEGGSMLAGVSSSIGGRSGGAVYARGSLRIEESVLRNNTANRGGALGYTVSTSVQVISSTLHDNIASIGGAIAGVSGGTFVPAIRIENSTITGNTATAGNGGGGFINGRVELINSTVSGNSAPGGSGGGLQIVGSGPTPETSSALDISNSIVAGNQAAAGGQDVSFLASLGFIDGGYNIIGVGGDHGPGFFLIDGLNGNQLGTVALPLDPLLGPLADNGGWVPTRRPLPGSPAIDRGNPNLAANPQTDARRVPRGLGALNDRADVGAFEANKFPTADIDTVHPSVDRQKEYWLQAAIFDSNNYDGQAQAPNPANPADVINLKENATYAFDLRPRGYADVAIAGQSVLPVVTNNRLRVLGRSATIERSGTSRDARILRIISSSIVELNEVRLQGGSLFTLPEDLTVPIAVSQIFGLHNFGGLISVNTSRLSLIRSTLRDGFAVRGAALHSTGTPSLITITDSTISENISMGGFAVLMEGGTGSNAIRHQWQNSTFSGNVADRRILESISPFLYNLSLSSQSHGTAAIGIYNPAGVSMLHVTVTDNEARGVRIMSGGILAGPTSIGANTRLRVENSIVAANRVLDPAPGSNPAQITPDIVIPEISGTPAAFSDGYNLIGVEPSGAGSGLGFVFGPQDLIGSEIAPLDPLLAPLGNYGGPTQTHALLRFSPAVDHIPAGTLLTDQRGRPRPARFGWDIGAYELGAFFIPCNDIVALIEAIQLSNLNPDPDEIFLDDDELCEGYDLDLTEGAFPWIGTNGLPTITTPITIYGQGRTLRRVNTPGIPQFRIFGVEPTGELNLENITLENGLNLNAPLVVERTGGAILNRGTVRLRANTILQNNRSQYGGAILSEESATLVIQNSRLTGNRAFTGGAIATWLDSTTEIRNASINDNIADIFGGGMATLFGSSATIERATFARNRSESLGGGLYVADPGSDVWILNSTFSGNSARDDGGGIYVATRDSGILNIDWSTITKNQSRRGGGIRYFAPMSIGNTILAGNSADIFGPDANGNLSITSLGHNLVGDLQGNAGFSAGMNDILGGVGLPLDPRLGPLTAGLAYGEVHPLLATSPTLDAGNPLSFPATDQRGTLRPVDGTGDGNALPDIGSVETNIFPVLIDSDNDGFSDEYEIQVGTNPNAGLAIPTGAERRLNPVVVLDPNPANTPRLGDLNNDGRLDRADLQILTQMAVGNMPTTPRADILGDGKVTVMDVTQFSNFIYGEIDILR